ncbi:MAG: Asp-tRNA(Asn)/Glu-tRNA(Gln) amidotransferase subunit GatB [Candidatus Margulisbacteria bacterium]|jgi:aspartyl-tRNA(Asn)/glutamyl-tRNA(Gln) amidotransferase subunit B|nr:Asp-tRNA(Asn)/Glu-tRNA(Gln) amidotransferase subunit GatB [Candidatus Margulisiibacteriota bacterium]
MDYETVIGLEVHAQLLTASKMFCSCPNQFGDKPNTNICPVCTGQPGVLPVTNKKAVELAIKTALALNCTVEPSSVFARKHYFYPDLPKNLQISQYELPLATKGHLEIEVDGVKRKIGITRVHLEEDAGKLVHQGAARIMGADSSLVDYNRTGTPLMEIVSEPDLRSPREAAVYTETLANLLRYLAVTDAKMEEGSLRCDANISLRPKGEAKFGTKTEVKNINSFRAIEKALLAEEKRHEEVLSEGGKITQETRFFDDVTETTTGMRGKEYAHDYRYFPEPDLVPVEPPRTWVAEIKATIGELPWQRKARFVGLSVAGEAAQLLVNDKPLADFLDAAVKLGAKAPTVANWLIGDITAYCKENKKELAGLNFPPAELAELLTLIEKGTLSNKIAKEVLFTALQTGKPVKEIVAASGMTQISDEGELLKIAQEVVKSNPKQVEQYKGGKEAVMMFLVGQMMKATKGRANPEAATRLLKQALG